MFYFIIYVCVSALCAHVYVCLHRPEEGFGSPGAGVAVGCEPPDMGAGI